MKSSVPPLGCLLLVALLLSPAAVAGEENGSPPDPTSDAQATPVGSPNGASDQPSRDSEIPYDPALIGLPGFPWPMSAPGDLEKALDLIDAKLAETTAELAAARAEAAGAEADPDRIEEAGSDESAEPFALAAAVRRIEKRIEVLGELRIAVQRNATLADRLAESRSKLEQLQAQVAAVEADGIAQEPPFPVSLLDRLQAELALKQGVEEVEETGVATAERRREAVSRDLSTAVSERRAARDRLKQAEADRSSEGDRTTLEEALEDARLNDLLAREQLDALESSGELARTEADIVEAQQALISERIRFLEDRVVLPADVLEEQLAKFAGAKDSMRADIEALQRSGAEAEAELFRAQRQLSEADEDADRAVLSEWVATRQAELSAIRTSVDNLAFALDILSRMETLWELRYRVMKEPESVDVADVLQRVIKDLQETGNEKQSLVERLNALRAIQLAQSRRLGDPALSEGVREAMLVRRAAQELAERHGRALLETQDELIALLRGMRHQLQSRLKETHISLELLQARERLATWWDAEVVVIDDQSIRVRELVTALAMFVVVLLAVSLIRAGARRALQRRKVKSPKTEYGDLRLALSAVSGNTSQIFVLIAAFYVAMTVSGLASPTVKSWLWTLLVIAFYAQLGIWADAAMQDYFTRRRTRQEMRDPSMVTGYGLLMFFVRVGIWITVIVSLLAYFRYPVAGLVGALGVGSLAVAFAVQNILGDVFSSMAIILDKPFRVGDFVKAGETVGVIEHIGVKTTRIRSLSGEQVVLSNSDLLNSRIHNFKHFEERRIVFRIGVVYQTPRSLLEQIPDMLRAAVEEAPRTRFDRAHFAEYSDYSLRFEIVYYVLSPDFTVYMDAQQAINLDIHRRFEEAGISFAYPTQEILLRYATPQPAGYHS